MLKVEQISTWQQCMSLNAVWNHLLAESDIDIPFMTSEWFSLWFRLNEDEGEMMVCVVKDDDGLCAIVPLKKGTMKLRGVTMCTVSFAANYYSCRTGIISVRHHDSILETVIAHLRDTGVRYDVLYFDFVVKDSRTDTEIHSYLSRCGLPYREMPGEISPCISIETDWGTYWKGLSRNLRSKINHTSNLFKKAGSYEIVEHRQQDTIPLAMDALLHISRKTWKFKAGSAIASQQKSITFYTQFAQVLAELGWLHIWILKLHGVPIAFLFNIEYKDTTYFMKIGFDEEYRHLSPGLFLLHASIQQAFELKRKSYDMLGEDEPYKLKYAQQSTVHKKYYIFQKTAKGKVLHIIEQYLVQTVAGWWQRLKSLRGGR